MYEVLKMVFMFAVVGIGCFMAIFPKKAVKEEHAGDEAEINKMRKYGIVCATLGMISLVITLISNVIY